jgi:hypothetical protein
MPSPAASVTDGCRPSTPVTDSRQDVSIFSHPPCDDAAVEWAPPSTAGSGDWEALPGESVKVNIPPNPRISPPGGREA